MEHSDWEEVQAHPDIMGGEPCIGSSRIPVRVIYDLYKEGASIEEIKEAYPSLTESQILSAIRFVVEYSESPSDGDK